MSAENSDDSPSSSPPPKTPRLADLSNVTTEDTESVNIDSALEECSKVERDCSATVVKRLTSDGCQNTSVAFYLSDNTLEKTDDEVFPASKLPDGISQECEKKTRKLNSGLKEQNLQVSNLLYSVYYGKQNDVIRYKDQGMDMSQADYDNRTALHVAAAQGHEDIVRYLLEVCDVDPFLEDRWQDTAYDDANRFEFAQIGDILKQQMLQRNPDYVFSKMVPRLSHSEGNTYVEPFEKSGINISNEISAKNISYDGGEVPTEEWIATVSVMLYNAALGQTDAIKRYKDQGMDMSQSDYDGRTALHLAAAEGHEGVVRFLLEECDVDPLVKDRWNHTALTEAKRFEHWQLSTYLQEHITGQIKKDDKTTISSLKFKPELQEIYLKALSEGTETRKAIRVMVVGHFDVGKTSLTRNLLGMHLDEINRTNGIDVHNYKCSITNDGNWVMDSIKSCKPDDEIERLVNVARSLRSNTLTECNMPEYLKDTRQKGTPTKDKNTMLEFIRTPSIDEKESVIVDNNVSDRKTKNRQQTYTTQIVDGEKMEAFATCIGQRSNDIHKKINIWDFGGQYIFYATHQLFHTQNAVYLLVLDLSKSLHTLVVDKDFPVGPYARDVHSFCKFWMHSIHSFVGNENGEPPVILVGTHKDLLEGDDEEDKDSEADEYLCNVKQIFINSPAVKNHIQDEQFKIDNLSSDDGTIEQLRKCIINVAEQCSAYITDTPAKWIPLENILLLIKQNGEKYITFEQVCETDDGNDIPIRDRKEIRLFLEYHHSIGSLIYFDEDVLSEYVILDPQWIIDAFKSIISARMFCRQRRGLNKEWQVLKDKAILEPKLIDEVWKNDRKNNFFNNKDLLLIIFQKLGIISKVRYFDVDSNEELHCEYYIVPSLLKQSSDKTNANEFLETRRSTSTCLVFKFENGYVCQTLYHRTTAAAVGKWPVVIFRKKRLLFENIGVYELDISHAGIIEVTNGSIEIRIVSLSKSPVEVTQSDRFRRFVKMALDHELKRVQPGAKSQYDLCIRCNHNNKRGDVLKELALIKTCKTQSVPCPDNISGHELEVNAVMHEWFIDDKIKCDTAEKSLSRKVTEQERNILANAIGDGWKLLGISLNLPQVKIDQINEDYPTVAIKIFHMLDEWVKQVGEDATVLSLLNRIKECADSFRVNIDWDLISNMIDKFPW